MNKWEIAQIFYEIADLLDILGENPFKARAYRKAAHILESTLLDIAELSTEGRLQEVPGIGDALAKKIKELVETGRLNYYEELKERIPPSTRQLLMIPGVGVKTARLLFRELNITSLEELEEAAREQRLQGLPGIGEKTKEAILQGLKELVGERPKWLLNFAFAAAGEVASFLNGIPGVVEVSAAGSLRRGREMVEALDFVASGTDPEDVALAFIRAPFVQEVVAGKAPTAVTTKWGIQANLLAVRPEQFASALQYLTGSRAHNKCLQGIARKRGWKLDKYGVDLGKRIVTPKSEEDLYQLLEMPYIPPELREGQGEIEAALAGNLPVLVDIGDIKGDLHVHSNWSDGANSIEEIALAARERGYSYLAITDHSRSLRVARGLDEEKLRQQRLEIESVNRMFDDFQLLAGIEVDILPDGSLDFDDDILEEMDVVIASIHSGFKQDRDTLTSRIITAIRNEHVDIIGHPSGRLLGRRGPYQIDMERVLDAAAETGTALEINASPDRLDLNDRYIRLGKERGVRFSINTDAHGRHCLADMRYGVLTARRGWAEKEDIINTMPLSELRKWLQNKSR
ncbi:DNA polymerase/3'-5' exonuclease PolX [Thermacetogenium phaeum DSM 12270]|uniref:DNA polymerase beta n=1 Tax=Thermacetogenium phaeum (strain ATCC BAA-254 / DSM 26808 / PB) TaxID=1089553 RepID=K4LU48_THEPS|nr:DNA polymerase/3'-5' exonuclease PolX [Thermacetogenium phaeum]AFV11554.1 DNA polymerase/3'-5' exonuclease PolX [Thermacetogenium phaeum DSM 12270]